MPAEPPASPERLAMAGRLQTKRTQRIGIIGSAEGEKSGLKAAVYPVARGYVCICMDPIRP